MTETREHQFWAEQYERTCKVIKDRGALTQEFIDMVCRAYVAQEFTEEEIQIHRVIMEKVLHLDDYAN